MLVPRCSRFVRATSLLPLLLGSYFLTGFQQHFHWFTRISTSCCNELRTENAERVTSSSPHARLNEVARSTPRILGVSNITLTSSTSLLFEDGDLASPCSRLRLDFPIYLWTFHRGLMWVGWIENGTDVETWAHILLHRGKKYIMEVEMGGNRWERWKDHVYITKFQHGVALRDICCRGFGNVGS